MRIFGLPILTLLALYGLPLAIIAYQYYVCWQIKKGRRE